MGGDLERVGCSVLGLSTHRESGYSREDFLMARTLSRRSFVSLSALLGPGLGFSLLGKAAGLFTPKLGIITDELAEDFEKALDFISSQSLAYCELRELWQKNLVRLSQQELERAKQLIERHRLKVSEIASPIFKYHLPGIPSPRPNWGDTFKAADLTDRDTDDLLQRVFKLAPFFGTSKVRVFSYWRVEDPEKAYPHVRDRLAEAAAQAGRHNITLLLENETDCNIGTGKELGRMLREINSPSLRGMWDPCNALGLGEVPFPDGYRAVRGLFRHMHIKDMKKDPATGKFQYVPVGKGMIDYRGQFRALSDDGYDGTMSLETSYLRPDGNRIESTRECLEGLLSVLKSVNA
jgi:L-ribulose-5-phosphate 3-epimerase